MIIRVSKEVLSGLLDEITNTFSCDAIKAEKHLKETIHGLAIANNIKSNEIENFVTTACSHVYYDATRACELAIKAVIFDLIQELNKLD